MGCSGVALPKGRWVSPNVGSSQSSVLRNNSSLSSSSGISLPSLSRNAQHYGTNGPKCKTYLKDSRLGAPLLNVLPLGAGEMQTSAGGCRAGGRPREGGNISAGHWPQPPMRSFHEHRSADSVADAPNSANPSPNGISEGEPKSHRPYKLNSNCRTLSLWPHIFCNLSDDSATNKSEKAVMSDHRDPSRPSYLEGCQRKCVEPSLSTVECVGHFAVPMPKPEQIQATWQPQAQPARAVP